LFTFSLVWYVISLDEHTLSTYWDEHTLSTYWDEHTNNMNMFSDDTSLYCVVEDQTSAAESLN
jgi:hypothetical protein